MSLMLNKDMGLQHDRTHSIDILFVYPLPSLYSPERFVALSVLYPNAACERAGYKTEVHDCRFENDEALWEKIEQSKVVAFSTMSGTQLSETLRISEKVRKINPFARIVWGGVHPTVVKEQCFDEPCVDYLILSEGEDRVVKLMDHIFHEKDLIAIDGIGYRCNDSSAIQSTLEIKTSGETARKNSHDIEFRQGHGWVIQEAKENVDLEGNYCSPITPKTEKYFGVSVPMLPSRRGCPYRCSFCSVPQQYISRSSRPIPNEAWRADVSKMIELWEAAGNPRIKTFELNDENSLSPGAMEPYVRFLWETYGIGTHLHIRADQLQRKENVQKFKEMGVQKVHIGMESGSPRVLKNVMLKDANPEVYRRVAKILAEVGIYAVYTAIIGNPTETVSERNETLDLLDELHEIHAKSVGSRATVYTLIPLPGTTVMDICIREGWNIPNTTRGWSQVSAASNPQSKVGANIYWISGLWYNRGKDGKTGRNFGKWRWLIWPFEQLASLRHKKRYYDYFDVEKWIIEKLIAWRAKSHQDTDIVMSESISGSVLSGRGSGGW
jgi:anaerobic magnesium-protoporphyrin IX monomethyl ester cyclase